MTPNLRIQLLGEFRLLVDDQPLVSFNQRRQQALLAYLLLHRHAPQSRQRIAFSFWPDSTDSRAHANLRKLFFMVREALPSADLFLYFDNQNIGWQPDAPYTLDVAVLEDALDELKQTATPAVSTVERAVALYRGELVPTCYEEWLQPIRRALHERVVNILTQALVGLEAQHEVQVGLRTAEHLLRLDPLHETAYRQLMHLRALSGDRAGALRIYHECATVLEQGLDVPPGAATQALYQRLLKLEPPPEGAAPAPQAIQIPLVGRQAEWRALQQAWRNVTRRGPHLVTVWGEAGVGKTRLVEELLRWARLQPGSVAYTRAYAAEGALAYAPLTEWLRSEALRPILAQAEKVRLTELARLLPELQRKHPDLPAPMPMTEGWQRQRFHEALAQVALAAPNPLLLVLDDLQWCDGATLTWLRYLLRFDAQAPLLVVGTARSEAVDEQHPLHDLLQHLKREGQCTELTLAPLSLEETAELGGHLAGADITRWATQLYRETEGNPLFVVETVRAGLVASQADSTYDQAAALPPKVQAVIGARLAQLSPPARQLAQLAATIGRAFTVDVLAAASDSDEDVLVQRLDELWQRRLLREQGEGYDFCHDKIREVAYGEISPIRRRHLHLRIAQAMERLYAPNLEAICGKLGLHYEAAGEHSKAVAYWLQAGEHALDTYAFQQAVRHYERALALAAHPTAKVDACSGLARAYFALDNLAEAMANCNQGLRLLDEVDPRRAKLLHRLAEIHFARYEVDACESCAQAALLAAEAADDQETVCQSLSLLGQVCSTRGNLDREMQLITRALHLCRQAGNRWREGRTFADLGWLQAQRGEFVEAVVSAERALGLLERDATEDRAGIAFAWNVLGRAQGGCGNYQVAFAAFHRSRELAEAIDHKFLMAQAPNLLGWLHQQLCDYRQALILDQEGVELAQQWNKTPAEISARINVAIDILHLGDPEQALTQLQGIQRRIEQETFGFHAWRWRLRLLEGQGLCYLALKQPRHALALAQEGQILAEATTSRKYLAANHALTGMALTQLGQTAEAIAELQRAVALADHIGYPPLRWAGRHDLAKLYEDTGRDDAARTCRLDAVLVIRTIADGLVESSLRSAFLDSAPVQAVRRAAQVAEPD